jgi:hypothetical protein
VFLLLDSMVTKRQRAAAANARAARHHPRATDNSSQSRSRSQSCVSFTLDLGSASEPCNVQSVPIEVDSDSEYDCGYEGGVNCQWSDTEYDGTDSEWSDSDGDSLAELDGDELEANLRELREEVEAPGAPSKYAQISTKKSALEWKKAEGNRAMGYTGNSKRTQQRKAKEAR